METNVSPSLPLEDPHHIHLTPAQSPAFPSRSLNSLLLVRGKKCSGRQINNYRTLLTLWSCLREVGEHSLPPHTFTPSWFHMTPSSYSLHFSLIVHIIVSLTAKPSWALKRREQQNALKSPGAQLTHTRGFKAGGERGFSSNYKRQTYLLFSFSFFFRGFVLVFFFFLVVSAN